MRTNIDIDDKLMRAAMKAAGVGTKKAAVEAALRQMVQLKRQERIGRWFGKIAWEGDLKAARVGRFLGPDGFHDRPEWHETQVRSAKRPTKATPLGTVAAD